MPRYRLKLKWTIWGVFNPTPVQSRVDDAVDVARQNNVTGPNGDPIKIHRHGESDGATWIVEGRASDVDNMITIWEGNLNVTVRKYQILTDSQVTEMAVKLRDALFKHYK